MNPKTSDRRHQTSVIKQQTGTKHRTSSIGHRLLALFLTFTVLLPTVTPYNNLWANNNGPNAPEASGFEPVTATDMVNLSSGDMAYVLPLFEMEGFPVTLNYHAGIPMEMESSWVGLGWNINTGAIARGVSANPDDWNGGKSATFTLLEGETEDYVVNIGVGIPKAAEIGVGLSWGSNKSLSGSVNASVGPISASISTDGNYSVGVGLNLSKEGGKYGGGLNASISGNVGEKGLSPSVGISASTSSYRASLGVSENGFNMSVSGSNGEGVSTGSSISMNSFAAGDFSYNTSGFYIPIQLYIFSFGFGYQKTEIRLSEVNKKNAYGALYHNDASLYSFSNTEGNPDNTFIDYQRRNVYGDVFEEELPSEPEDFAFLSSEKIKKLNFTSAGYDSYEVNSPGLSGQLKPLIGKSSVLIGEGYEGELSASKRSRVYYHKGNLDSRPVNSLSDETLNFSFEGQVNQDISAIGTFEPKSTTTGNKISDFFTASNNVSRGKSGSFVEVFTNEQISSNENTQAKGVSIPMSLLGENRSALGYPDDGIGAYKITTPEGKTFHYAQPVYQYEEISYSYLFFEDAVNKSKYNSTSKRQATPYATHWLLTAITGPDYVDTNDNGYVDKEDYGYWIRLDHGRWSNAYSWRAPFSNKKLHESGVAKNYNTYIDSEVEKSDPGSFQQGRKDLYYLNKIVSKNQIAYFVKGMRSDARGSSADFVFDGDQVATDDITGDVKTADEDIIYTTQSQLSLDKIVITRNNENTEKVDVGDSSPSDTNWQSNTINNAYTPGGYIADNLPAPTKTHYLNQNQNVIDVNDFEAFDYSEATKVIKFNYNYSLAQNTPSSYAAPNMGRLTLESVQNFGSGAKENEISTEDDLYDYMPPYEFKYYAPNLQYSRDEPDASGKFVRANKDNWGFREDHPEAWSLAIIKNPLGAKIKIEYEEDDFYTEAFTRRYWDTGLIFKMTSYAKGTSNDYVNLTISKQSGSGDSFKFSDYFSAGENLTYKLWMYGINLDWGDWCSHEREIGEFKILTQRLQSYPAEITEVNDDSMLIKQHLTVNYSNRRWNVLKSSDWDNYYLQNGGYGTPYGNFGSTIDELVQNLIAYNPDFTSVEHVAPFGGTGDIYISGLARMSDNNNKEWGGLFENEGGIGKRLLNRNFYRNMYRYQDTGFGGYPTADRGTCINQENGVANALDYRIIANNVPPGTSGGGLRVSKITIEDTNDNYITKYDYNNPETGKTSGITSFNPVRGEVYVPYQNLLPGPGTMYEYVTVGEYKKGDGIVQEELIKKTRYRYHVLKPIDDIFDKNLRVKDIYHEPEDDGDESNDKYFFKANEVSSARFFSVDQSQAKTLQISKNLSKIGQLVSQEIFNSENQLLSKTSYEYETRNGSTSESFVIMKSVFTYDYDGEDDRYSNPDLNGRYMSLSNLEKEVDVLSKISTTDYTGTSTVIYSDPDEYLGTFNKSTKTLADGTEVIEEKTPAYTQYPAMGSKIINSSNKNMLVQPLLNTTTVNGKTLNASLTTWSNDWTYRDDTGAFVTPTANDQKIWRKKAAYIWKDAINDDGTYLTTVGKDNMYFNFTTNQPTSSKWQLSSETEQYNHFSVPIQVKDINDNYASTIVGDEDKLTLAVCNAKFTESYYSGAEYLSKDNTGYFDHEIKSAGRSNDKAHTGEYSVLINSGQKAFELDMKLDEHSAEDYRLSVWVNKGKQNNVSIKVNGITKSFNSNETVIAGEWVLMNAIIPITSAATNIYVTSNSNGVYLDDFRLHPIASSMSSYVYDTKDQITYILGGNNMATKYEYDKAGRLFRLYTEVQDVPSNTGGFKLSKKSTYNYKR